MSLFEKIVNENLTQENIKNWLSKELKHENLGEEKLNHVAMCLHHIYLWYIGVLKPYHLGRFLTAILRNDFMDACGRADSTNAQVLPIYAKFLYNYMPLDYKERARKEFH